MFIIMSFSYGLAVYILVLMASYRFTERPLGDVILLRLKNLQAVFIAAVLYIVAVFHLTNLYFTKHHGIERFILVDGGIHTQLFWIGQVLLGGLIPLALLFHPRLGKSRGGIASAAALVIVGGFAQMYVTIIGGQAYPLVMFPGMQESSTFYDGVVHHYTPSIAEIMLGLGGIAIAGAMVVFAIKILRFLPESLENQVVDAHASKK